MFHCLGIHNYLFLHTRGSEREMTSFFLPLAVVILCYVAYHGLWYLPGILLWCYKRLQTALICARAILYLFWRSGEGGDVPIKQLNRVHVHPLRHYIHDYLSQLEKGQANALAQALYQRVPPHYRVKSNEGTSSHPLPLWMEQAIILTKNEKVRVVAQLTLFYLVLLFSSPLWMPYFTSLTMAPLEATQAALYAHLGLEVQPCMWASQETECFLYEEADIVGESALLRVAMRDIAFKGRAPPNETLDLLVDEGRGILLYPMDFVTPLNQPLENGPSPVIDRADTKETMVVRRYVNVEAQLMPLLMFLHNDESATTGHPCICALFLNIVSNVSFHYDASERRWLVMARPAIHRNNSFADLVASNMNYHRLSIFFEKHKRWRSLVPHELVHYDSFVVDYIEPVFSELTLTTSVGPLNEKLRDASFSEASLFSRVESSALHKQVHLSGDDAVCFIYCDALGRGYASAK